MKGVLLELRSQERWWRQRDRKHMGQCGVQDWTQGKWLIAGWGQASWNPCGPFGGGVRSWFGVLEPGEWGEDIIRWQKKHIEGLWTGHRAWEDKVASEEAALAWGQVGVGRKIWNEIKPILGISVPENRTALAQCPGSAHRRQLLRLKLLPSLIYQLLNKIHIWAWVQLPAMLRKTKRKKLIPSSQDYR